MKNFKRVLSLALAALMVIGGLVVAPVDAKADDTTYSRVYDVKDIKDGADVLVVAKYGDKYYALGKEIKNKMDAVEVTVADDKITASDLPVWTLTKTEKAVAKYQVGEYTISIGGKNLGYGGGTNFAEKASTEDAAKWILNETEDTFTITSVSADTRAVGFRQESAEKTPIFGAYAKSNASNSQYSFGLLLFKSGTVTSAADDVDPVLTAEFTTEAQIVEALKAMITANASGNVTDPGNGNTTFEVTGKITEITTAYDASKKNMTLTMACEADETVTIKCNTMITGENGPDMAALAVGDTIKVKGLLSQKDGVASFNYNCVLQAHTAGTGSTEKPDDTPESKPVTPDSPVADIVDAAFKLESGASLEGTYTLEGVVTNVKTVYSAAYGNVTVVFKVADKEIQCFRLKGEGVNSISKGDTIKVEGTIKNNNGTVEFTTGCKLVSRTSELPTVPALKENATPSEIVAAANALGKWQALAEEVTITGKIVSIDTEYSAQYKNITVKIQVSDKETDTLLCYRLASKDKNDEAEIAKVAGLKDGDTIKVKGTIVNYNGTVEFSAPTLVEIIVVPEAGDFSIVLPLVLVLMGGAVVIVASKKRFA